MTAGPLDADTRFRSRDDVLVSSDGDAHFVTDLETGDVLDLNETARVALDAARAGRTVAGVADALAERYPGVPRDELDADVREVLEELVRRRVLRVA